MEAAAKKSASNTEEAPKSTPTEAAAPNTTSMEVAASKSASSEEAAPQESTSLPQSETQMKPRDGGITYMAWAKNSDNLDEIMETNRFLNNTVVDKSERINFCKPRPGKRLLWGSLTLDDAALKKVQEYPGIERVLVEPDVDEDFVIPSINESVSTGWFADAIQAKRSTSDWKKQDPAPKNLAFISQPKDTQQKDYNDFVYQAKAGEGVYIYVIDTGVAYNVEYEAGEREFPKGKAFSLQTEDSKFRKDPEDSDSHANSHGTKVASVALGQRFGVAKGATLIAVKAIPTVVDRLEAVELVYEDIVNNPDRVKKCVVVTPWTVKNNDPAYEEAFTIVFKRLLGLGVPVVAAAGNERKRSDDIDKLPPLLFGPKFPIINVGGSDNNGVRGGSSQGGSKLAIYAPGQGVELSDKDGKSVVGSGTSFASPAVAGLIATYMAYDTIPWDDSKKGIERVQAIMSFVQSDASSVIRNTETKLRIIWNGATIEDHKDAQSEGSSPLPYKPGTCVVSVILTQELYSPVSQTYGWEGDIYNAAGARINGCSTQYQIHPTSEDFSIGCDPLKNGVTVHVGDRDVLDFKFGDQTWNSADKNACADGSWAQVNDKPVSDIPVLSALGIQH
ncbi:subtilisin-like protein [Dothidotthia symphoricarpi CBS 119687]|uniref:Subtilisin-like protein n=1 Tax=Dothidotthia symphoricarpi CBS 119687 TaxID=1392245 RepID=A0A6A6A0A2_9PLEO|nr:subtilisin-like protein [Dothidotthia symphoricarpi CBS 119687]KAF2125230.1 subtilisin-like protein [Dothidotthia symphoricarpi CBS 119687]